MKNHILSIGISKHQISTANLSYASKDASEFFELCKINVNDIGHQKLLIDSEATLSQIRAALGSELQSEIQPDDSFFFFYSGHGVIAADPDQENYASHYLVPYDATFDIVNTCIPVSYLKQIFSKLISKSIFIFIDSCFSGSVSKNSKLFPAPKFKDFTKIKTFENTVSGVGSLTFTASKDDEEALEDSEFKNGLFTYFLLDELQKEREEEKFAVLNIFAPICDNVKLRAKEKYNHTQTPTFHGRLEGNLLLPTFKRRIKLSPQLIDIPRHPELSSSTFTVPSLQFGDQELENRVNDLIKLIYQNNTSTHNILFERYCLKLFKNLKKDWEIILTEFGGNVSEIPNAVLKLESASFEVFLISAVLTVFGTEEHRAIFYENVVEILKFSEGHDGYVALLSTPEIIIAELIYIVGILCIARKNISPLIELLNVNVYDLYGYDNPPQKLLYQTQIHYCEALGGHSTKVNDHIREILISFNWLSEFAPKLDEKIVDFQIQANFLLVMLTLRYKEYLWPDFARWYKKSLMPLVNIIKYDNNFKKQVSKAFNVKDTEIGDLFNKYLIQLKEKGLDRYIWKSIDENSFLNAKE